MEKIETKDWGDHFQTPKYICEYMASMVPDNCGTILEPTPGKGNLLSVIKNKGIVTAPDDFYKMEHKQRFDYIVMNPPFTPMAQGYKILYSCMDMSDNIIALMPYLCIINGAKRTEDIMNFGLKSITHLPRSVFNGSRVQTCILEMRKYYRGPTEFKLLPNKQLSL